MAGTVLGCDRFLRDIPSEILKGSAALLCNQASVTGTLRPLPEELARHGVNLRFLLSPQHGFFSEKQANMVESDHELHPGLGIPVYSLYGPMFSPSPDLFNDIDFLLVDLQDVGTRVYTYMTTMGLVLEALSGVDIRIWILDRPNPLGTEVVEGNIVEPDYKSFVGRYSLPMRHGLTPGEYCLWVVKEKGLDLDVRIISMENWRSDFLFPETGLFWIFPSPNMPSCETALVYPGMVLLEGTNISEGRGTTLPFQLFGAPFINPYKVQDRFDAACDSSVTLRPVYFEPVADKWKGMKCGGFQVHVLDVRRFRPFRFGLKILRTLLELFPEDFRWLPPPYEYEFEKLPIDIILGSKKLREALESGIPVEELEVSWAESISQYLIIRDSCRLYP